MRTYLESEKLEQHYYVGMYSDKESYLKVGGKQEDLAKVSSERTWVNKHSRSEKLTETFDKMLDTLVDRDKILNLTKKKKKKSIGLLVVAPLM